MNIKVPKSMQSPTVLIIGQGTMNEKIPASALEKRMDFLERQFDKWYRIIAKQKKEKPQKPQKPLVIVNKSFVDTGNLRVMKAMETRLRFLGKPQVDAKFIKSLNTKFDRLEKAFSSVKNNGETKRIVRYGNNDSLKKSLSEWMSRIEKKIESVRPRNFSTHG